MDNHRTGVEVDKEIFATAATGSHCLVLNVSGQFPGDGPAHTVLMNHHFEQAAACRDGVYSPSGGLNFW